MDRVKDPVRAYATTGERAPPEFFYGTAIFMLRSLLVALMVTLAGCATPERPPDQAPLPIHVPESTWWQVDNDIGDASLAATESARDAARVAPWITG